MNDTQRKQYLLEKYLRNTCTPEELEELYDVLASEEDTTPYKEVLSRLWLDIKEEKKMGREKAESMLRHILSADTGKRPVKRIAFYWKAAAVLVPVMALTALLWQRTHPSEKTRPYTEAMAPRNSNSDTRSPGSHKAILVLDDGRRLDLADSTKKQLLTAGGIRAYNDSDRLVYEEPATGNTAHSTRYNTLITPGGGEYMVVLGDGTKVWLNAASSLRYPESFPDSIRKVELTGEAYFEVVHNSRQPFIVMARGVKVTDLGTAFNINAYTDEPEIKTTLVQGSLGVTDADEEKMTVLYPGYEARIDRNHRLQVVKPDLKSTLAWKNGLFSFSAESLGSIMRKLSRWYTMDVKINDTSLETLHFTGTIHKYEKIGSVLQMLQLTNEVTFIVHGNTLEVKRK